MALELARTPEQARQALSAKLRNPSVADDRIREHIRIVAGPQPYEHSHYAADRFFQFDAASGTLNNVYGQRLLRVGADFARALRESLVRELGDRAAEALYDIGFRWGEADMKSFVPRIEQEYECAFEKLAMGPMLESWWWPFRAAGWGVWRYDFSQTRAGLVFVELYGSATADPGEQTEKPRCDLYAGLYAAAFSHLAQRKLVCVELECAARGDSHCRFLVTAKRRADAAAAERDAGASVEDIINKLADVPA
jgi:predicted hydrocarbon binding protein